MIAGIYAAVAFGPNAQRRTPNAPIPKVAIFVHGAGGGGWEWSSWRPVFEKAGWVCVTQDLMPAKAGIAATRFSTYLTQVQNWGRLHRPSKLVLIGASMGGILALKASEKLKPDALVLVNSVGPLGAIPRNMKTYPSVIEWSKGTLKETQDSMPDSDDASIQFAFHHWRDESGAVLSAIANGITVEQPSCPLLVIISNRDTDVPNEIGKTIAKRFGGELQTFQGMSHVGPLLGTRAPKVAAFTVEWLNKHVR